MHSFKSSRILPFEAKLLNDIVLDIEKYPEFLPWCCLAEIISKEKDLIVADLTIQFKGFNGSYRSQIIPIKTKGLYTIEVKAISGPFKYLKNIWQIKELNKGSEVHFSIAFELKSKILDVLIGQVFSIAAEKMISAFEARAKEQICQ